MDSFKLLRWCSCWCVKQHVIVHTWLELHILLFIGVILYESGHWQIWIIWIYIQYVTAWLSFTPMTWNMWNNKLTAIWWNSECCGYCYMYRSTECLTGLLTLAYAEVFFSIWIHLWPPATSAVRENDFSYKLEMNFYAHLDNVWHRQVKDPLKLKKICLNHSEQVKRRTSQRQKYLSAAVLDYNFTVLPEEAASIPTAPLTILLFNKCLHSH